MFDSVSINEGMLIENVVAQMLTARNLDLFFYSRSDREHAENRMELDFLLANEEMKRRKNVSLVEVKSEKDYSTDSLDKFCRKFQSSIGLTYVLHPGDVSDEGNVIRLPLYMAPWIELKRS